MKLSSFTLGVVLLACLATPSFADEKIFRLKNGRKIQGELLEETPTSYVVKTAGGKTTLPKETVAAVEDPPAPSKPFLEPDPKKPEPAPDKTPSDDNPPARPDRGGGDSSGTTTPGKSGGDTPSVVSSPLAGDDTIADVKKALLALPPINPDDLAGSNTARNKAIDTLLKKQDALAALVAIVAEPENAAHPKAPPERLAALEIVTQKAQPEKTRPLFAQAIANINLEQGVPNQLLNGIYSVGDSDDGVVGAALVAKVADILGRGQAPDAILAPLEQFVRPELHFAKLFKLLITPDKANAQDSLGAICKKIVIFQRDREVAIRVIAPLIDARKLPPYVRLAPALDVLGASRGRDGADAITRILDALDQVAEVPADQKNAYTVCLRNAYGALVSNWTPESRDRLLRALDEARTPERRILVLEGFRAVKPGLYALERDFAQALIDRMADRTRTEEEVRAFAYALQVVVNKNLGNDPASWQNYLDAQPR